MLKSPFVYSSFALLAAHYHAPRRNHYPSQLTPKLTPTIFSHTVVSLADLQAAHAILQVHLHGISQPKYPHFCTWLTGDLAEFSARAKSAETPVFMRVGRRFAHN